MIENAVIYVVIKPIFYTSEMKKKLLSIFLNQDLHIHDME